MAGGSRVVAPSSVAVSWGELAAAQKECPVTTLLAASKVLLVESVVCGDATVLVN